MVRRAPLLLVLIGLSAPTVVAHDGEAQVQTQPAQRLNVFLDCPNGCFDEFLREEVDFVDYVRHREEADVHVLITRADTGSSGREYTLAFIGLKEAQGKDHTLKSVSEPSDTEDHIRRGLATTLRIGLLGYVARTGTPRGLDVSVRQKAEKGPPRPGSDPWKNWVFSIRGSTSFDAQESSREWDLSSSLSADRITRDWKISFGGNVEHLTEHFDLDEDEPVRSFRRESEFTWLIVKGLGEHWSAGAMGEVSASTFDNTRLAVRGSPAIEYNYFPYSEYTRRQLRILYAIGAERVSYLEITLFGRLEETLTKQELSMTYEQKEPWGSLEMRVQGSNFFPGFEKYRIEVEGDVSLRIARGLSLSLDGRASRIRDQLSLRRRGATSEEVLLRLRRLQSGYQVDFSVGVTYTFGSIFSSIVNPRFGT